MGKALLIAEKNSVAQSIAEAVGAQKKDMFWENEKYIIAYCNGHLVRNLEPWEYDKSFKKWSLVGLPFIPDGWVTCCDRENKFLMNKLTAQFLRKDVTSLICATDPEREGELIFREILDHFCSACFSSGKDYSSVPVYRLWLSSVEFSAIREGLENLKEDSEFDGLYYAALARNHSDWLIGMNLSRFYSVLHGRGKFTYNVGRLITPLVCEIVRREEQIRGFEKDGTKTSFLIRKTSGRLVFESPLCNSEKEAKDLLQSCAYSPLLVSSIEKETYKINAPKLFSLTALQQKAFEEKGFEALRTLELLQSCYEKRLLSYPRTDSSYIDEKTRRSFDGVLELLCPLHNVESTKINSANVVNDKLVSGHPALLVTHYYATLKTEGKLEEKTSEEERTLLEIVEDRMILSALAPMLCTRYVIGAKCSSLRFTSKALVIIHEEGFLEYAPRVRNRVESLNEVESLFEGYVLKTDKTEIVRNEQNVPERYNDSTLLEWMNKVGSSVLPQEMIMRGQGGIGRSSTRAEAIERIIESGYVRRLEDGKRSSLFPTDTAFKLMSFADRRLCDENTTAMWELQLQEVENKNADGFDFIKQTEDYVRSLIESDGRVKGDVEVAKCPVCSASMIDGGSGFFCTNDECGFTFYKDLKVPAVTLDDRQMICLLEGKAVPLRLLTKDGKRYYEKTYIFDEEASRKWNSVRIKPYEGKEKKE